ncbi:MAG TPA: PsbP-related protein [Candidatus Acidoferrales bacterium]|nr:PsbP-related protein [Candidatus Acidoferrales bacterium]
MKAIGHFFKTIDDFLNVCVDYLDGRVRTGKFVGDIAYIIKNTTRSIYYLMRRLFAPVIRSKPALILLKFLNTFWLTLLKIPLFETLVSMLTVLIKIIVICYSEIFIVFAFTFTTSIILLNFFQTSIATFIITLIPVLLLDIFFVAALFYCIDRRVSGDHISIWHSFPVVFRHFITFGFPVITLSAIVLELLIIFSITSLFISYVFDLFQTPWSGSFLYWFIVIFIGSLLFVGIFFISIIMNQTFYAVLLDHIPFQQALNRGRRHVLDNITYYLFFYILLYLSCAIFIWKAVLSYLYLGLTIGLYSTIALSSFLGYLLRRKFPFDSLAYDVNLNINQKTYLFCLVLIFFGFINYLLVAVLLVKEYQPLLAFVQQQQNNIFATEDLKQFTNDGYGYTIDYPQRWSVYQWNKQSVTFYNNYTGTLTGGTWMTISVTQYKGSIFKKLYNANPGVLMNNSPSKDITTKVSNLVIQDYDAVNYTYIKSGYPYAQYETHYLIHKDTNVVDIAFLSLANDVSGYNSDLFQKIINSFRFDK